MKFSWKPRFSRKVWIAIILAVLYFAGALTFNLFGRRLPGVAYLPLRIVFLPANWVAGFFLGNNSQGADLTELQLKALRITSTEVYPRIDSVGAIDFFEKVEINAKSSGRIEKFFVREGQVVNKGQTLVQLERTFLELELAQQRAAYDAAQSELRLSSETYETARRRAESKFKELEKQSTLVKKLRADLEKARVTYSGKEILFKEGGVSREEYETMRTELISKEAAFQMSQRDFEIASIGLRDQDLVAKGITVSSDPAERTNQLTKLNVAIEQAQVDVARSRVKSAEAAMNSTQVLLKEATITSPITGMVAARTKSVGEQVLGGTAGNAAQAIMTLVDINRVYAVMNIKESDLKDISQGMELQFTSDAYAKDNYKGRIEVINPIVDSKTHTFEVRALLVNPGRKLRPGMFIRSSIITGKPVQMIMVPAASILPQEGENAIAFVVRDGSLFRKDIVTGKQQGDFLEVKSGLASGDVIANEKVSQLREGMRIRPVLEK